MSKKTLQKTKARPLSPETIQAQARPEEAPEELRRRYADLSTLYMVGARLSAILQWEPLLLEILETAIHLTQANGASLILPDNYRGDFFIAASRHLSAHIVKETRIKSGEGIAGWVAQNREPLLLVGPVTGNRFTNFSAKPTQVGSAICVPLVPPAMSAQASPLVGVLVVSRRNQAQPFSQDDMQLLYALSTQAATALENARQYQKMQRRATQLQNLIDISREMATSLNLDQVLRQIMEKAVLLLRAQAGSLLLVDEETKELIFKVALGPAGAILSDTRLPPGVGIAGAVARDGKPLIVNDAQADPRHYGGVDASTALTTQTLVCVPLISRSRIIGVLEVINKADGTPFAEEDSDTLAAFALEGAIALENARLYSELKQAFTDTVRVIANAVEARDPYTAGHTGRVTQLAIETARELKWTTEQIEILEIGALLHDIGKIGVSDAILRKPGHLTDDEYTEMKKHPIVGANMLEGVGLLRPILAYVLYHQERFDGSGYPFGLKGKEIPIEGRLLPVVDTFDAMTSDRPYRKGRQPAEAIAEIVRNRGTQFDPEIVDAFLRAYKRIDFESLYHRPAAPLDTPREKQYNA
ncbi:MAG: GAF domain-containing protein [Chloroflexi bacterium]|nr:GAF domain-containing protein [Chloroflexota bacterium]